MRITIKAAISRLESAADVSTPLLRPGNGAAPGNVVLT